MQLIYIVGISMVLLAFFGCATKQGEVPAEEIPLVFTPTSGEEVIAVPTMTETPTSTVAPTLAPTNSARAPSPTRTPRNTSTPTGTPIPKRTPNYAPLSRATTAGRALCPADGDPEIPDLDSVDYI